MQISTRSIWVLYVQRKLHEKKKYLSKIYFKTSYLFFFLLFVFFVFSESIKAHRCNKDLLSTIAILSWCLSVLYSNFCRVLYDFVHSLPLLSDLIQLGLRVRIAFVEPDLSPYVAKQRYSSVSQDCLLRQ